MLRYFDEYGMTSTHRRNTELMERCANEVGTTLERVKVCVCVRARVCVYKVPYMYMNKLMPK